MELNELMNYSATHWEPGTVTGPAATVGAHTFKTAALRPMYNQAGFTGVTSK